MINNLTEGKPLKLLFFFVILMMVESLFQQLYNMVDSMVADRLMGEDAPAATGSFFPVVLLLVAMAAGLSMGCTVAISQFFKMGETREMKVTVSTTLTSLSVIGLIMMGVSELVAGPLLKLLETDSDVTADSLAHSRIYFGGAILLFLYNSLNGIYNILRGNQTPLKFLMVSALASIILGLLFVIKFNMGVAGAAWAILIAQGLCACISFFVLIGRLKKMGDRSSAREAAFAYFDMDAAKRATKVGIPSMFQQSVVSVSMMMMQGLVNSYGRTLVAGYTTATKIDTLAMLPNMNFSSAISGYAARNVGASKMDRVKQGYKSCMFMVFIFPLIITTLIYLLGPQLLGPFLNQGAKGSAMSYGFKYTKTVSTSYLLMGALFVDNGLLCGAGDMGAFILSSMVSLFSRVAIAYFLVYYIGASVI